jgi:large subunit ribosomal protein L17
MLSNMASSLILHKRIETTLAKAKELRVFVEPLLTKTRQDTTHSRRVVFATLKNKYVIKELFGDVAEKVAQRQGGYTRILRTGFRTGDAAETAIIELVDYNATYTQSVTGSKSERKRTRRGKKSATAEKPVETPVAVTPQAAEKPVTSETPDVAAEAATPATE